MLNDEEMVDGEDNKNRRNIQFFSKVFIALFSLQSPCRPPLDAFKLIYPPS